MSTILDVLSICRVHRLGVTRGYNKHYYFWLSPTALLPYFLKTPKNHSTTVNGHYFLFYFCSLAPAAFRKTWGLLMWSAVIFMINCVLNNLVYALTSDLMWIRLPKRGERVLNYRKNIPKISINPFVFLVAVNMSLVTPRIGNMKKIKVLLFSWVALLVNLIESTI